MISRHEFERFPFTVLRMVFMASLASILLVAVQTAPAAAQCVGDCNGDGQVAINELIIGVNIALGSAAVEACPAMDANGDGEVTINELIGAVNNALAGCPVVSPTDTPDETPTPTETDTEMPTATETATEMPTATETATEMPTPTETATEMPTATVPPAIGEHQCTLGSGSQINLNTALGLPLLYPMVGTVDLTFGSPDGDGKALARCEIQSMEPINIPGIGFVCLDAPPEPCDDGEIDCDGGNDLGLSLQSDDIAGACTSNVECDTVCAAHCAGLGAGFAVHADGACTGYCSAGAEGECDKDIDCLPDDGACNGPDLVRSAFHREDICQCHCIDKAAAGAAGVAGEMQCNLPVDINVENLPPCDGDVKIAVGADCVELTTQSAVGFTTNANFNDCGVPPCQLPVAGASVLSGSAISCTTIETSVTSGLQSRGHVNFFGSSLGDLVVSLSINCE